MVKRFGEGVSMTDIESFAVNRTLEEMKENARKKEMALFRKIKDSDVSRDLSRIKNWLNTHFRRNKRTKIKRYMLYIQKSR